jgi:NADPH:quinone reductase-like Zn-dependent oxidoreductase
MRAVTVDERGAAPAVRDDMPAPAPGDREVIVRVHASSVNPVDNAIASGMLEDMVEHVFPVTLGRDYAGVVEQVGAGVTGLSTGDEVFGFMPGMSPNVHDGSWAELIAVPAASVARKPAGVDAAAAGAAPLAAVTAMMCVDALDLARGAAVLIVGASGGVGSLAVQLAAAAGATVIAPGLPEDEDYLRGLGATDVPPRDGDVVAAVRERHPDGVDAILDAVSYTPGSYDSALKDGGRVASPTNAAGDGPGRANVMSVPLPEYLQRVARLLDAGTLRVNIRRAYPLERAGEALRALAAEHTQGKLAIRFD